MQINNCKLGTINLVRNHMLDYFFIKSFLIFLRFVIDNEQFLITDNVKNYLRLNN